MLTKLIAIAPCIVAVLAAPLVRGADPQSEPGLLLRIYDIGQSMEQIPDLSPKQLPSAVKLVPTVNLDPAKGDFAGLKEYFAADLVGFVKIDQPGSYTFRLISDDGSKLWIDEQLVVDNDGPHAAEPKDGKIDLKVGPHALLIRYFQGGGDGDLELQWATPADAAKFVLVPASALTHDAAESQQISPGNKRIIPALHRGRPGDGAPLAGPNPGFTFGAPPIVVDKELNPWLSDGRLRIIGRTAPAGAKSPVAWLPADEGAKAAPLIFKFDKAPYVGQLVAWMGTDEAQRIALDGAGATQACAFRFAKVAPGCPGPKDEVAFEMLAVHAMTNGFEIEFTKPLDPRVGWEADSYYCEQWPFDVAKHEGPTRDGTTTPVKSVSVFPDRKRVFLEIEGLKPSSVVYLRLLPPCISEDGELPWSTEAWYTLNAIPKDKPVLVVTPPPWPPENLLTDADKQAGWKLLFDGETTKGWHGFHKESVPDGWKVIDGCLVRTNSGGDIVTDGEFDNFELSFEWRISAAGNSGVMYHVSEDPKYKWPWETGPEYQILDNAEHADGRNPLTSAASCYALYAPPKDATVPVGLFNKGRIIVNNGHVEHWLNGVKVVEYQLGSPEWEKLVAASKFSKMPDYGRMKTGHIDLQDHGDKVWYRNIKIRPLGGQ